MRLFLAALSALLLFPLAAAAQDGAWTSLYNGENLNGWTHVGDGELLIEDGLLKTEGGMGLLWYTEQTVRDAQIRVEYMSPEGDNAGVFIRIPERPTEPWMPVNRGYEVQINPGGDAYHRTGVLYSLTEAKAEVGQPGAWNTMTITLDGDRTMVHVNGVLVTDYTEGDPVPEKQESYEPDRGPRPTEGYIGLQNHGGEDVVYFRSVKMRPLGE
ncbi:MAG: DUF1080 domain-containing protein [Bacteroidetes bacterium]|jgi:hypothetical protein|nr:DUF1080 domain-containing protein [Bacteroidota bacterium]